MKQFLGQAVAASSGADLKKVCLDNTGAIYLIVNDSELLTTLHLPSNIQKTLEGMFGTQLKGFSTNKLKTAFSGYVSLQDYDKYYNELERVIQSFDFGEIKKQLERIEVPNLGSQMKEFFQKILVQYFEKLEPIDKRRIMSYVVSHIPSNPNHSSMAMLVISASGPFFQKFIQMVSEDLEPGNDPQLQKLKEELSLVKSKLPSIAKVEIDHYLTQLNEKNVHVSVGKSIGAASVGEVFHATYNGQPVVIKFMRPGIEEIAKREQKIFESVAKEVDQGQSTAVTQTIAEVSRQVFEELDYEEEARKLKLGAGIYNDPNFPVSVAKLVQGFPQSKHWMAMELAHGVSIASLRSKKTESEMTDEEKIKSRVEMFSKAILLNILTQQVIEKTFFAKQGQPGFFHGDLHDGNIMIYIDPVVYQRINALDKANKENIKILMHQKDEHGQFLIRLTLVDFGNAHELNHRQSDALLNLLIASSAISLSAQGFLNAFSGLMTFDSDSDEYNPAHDMHLKKVLQEEAFMPDPEGKIEFSERFGNAVRIMMKQNIPIPGKVLAFLRTIKMLSTDYKVVKEDAEKMRYCFDLLKMNKEIVTFLGAQLKGPHNLFPGGHLNWHNVGATLTEGIPYVRKWVSNGFWTTFGYEPEWDPDEVISDEKLKSCHIVW